MDGRSGFAWEPYLPMDSGSPYVPLSGALDGSPFSGEGAPIIRCGSRSARKSPALAEHQLTIWPTIPTSMRATPMVMNVFQLWRISNTSPNVRPG